MHIEWRLPPALVRPVLIAGVLAALAAGVLWWLSAPVPEQSVAAPVLRALPSASTGRVLVDVIGAVRHPGVVRLPAGARVVDAVAAAGGLLRGRQPIVNMARVVVDGEQIVVGGGSESDAAVGAVAKAGSTVIDLNAATIAQLDALPGIGPVLAKRIVDYRSAHGGFAHKRDLLEVPGIGDATYARLADTVSTT